MASRVLVALLVGLLLLPAAQPLQAQGFMPSPFGYGPSPRPYPGYGHPYGYQGGSSYRAPYSPYQPYRGFDDDDQPLQRGYGMVRTLCVRLCDGFYFPISFATPRSALSRDADSCSASCGAEARLFYYANPGGDVETMVDLNGMAYQSLPNAFKYRKTLVANCRCRPQPWSETELQRHRAYAAGQPAADTGQGPAAPASTRAATTGLLRTPDDQTAIARPQPVDRQIEPRPLSSYPGASSWGSSKSKFVWPGDPR
jgi:Protein of unknown function (DUF2865)